MPRSNRNLVNCVIELALQTKVVEGTTNENRSFGVEFCAPLRHVLIKDDGELCDPVSVA
jgi:hypothetical protein